MVLNEEWRDVVGFEGRYQVSSCGRVKSLSRITQLNGRVRKEPEKIMAVTYRSGYPTLILRKNGVRKSAQVHRLVAEAFLPNPNNYPVVNHIDRSRTNNAVENLEWCTQGDNVRWSACNMRKPRKVCRKTNTGEKYISRRIANNGTIYFQVYIHSKSHNCCKKFSTIEEAVKFRNEKVSEIK